MEANIEEPNNPSPVPSDSPVLNISGNMEPKRSTPQVRGERKDAAPQPKPVTPLAPQVSPTTFPVITSRILFKTDVPPEAVPKSNPLDFDQYLCFLCMEKPSSRKRVYHMYLSNEKDMEKERIRKMYENRKDLKIVDRMYQESLCARSLCHRVQNKLTDVTWNKQKTIFETDWVGERDVWNLSERIYKLHYEELEKLFNYIKFMSATNR
ncbi:uncharacterized protein LOC110177821 [Drosophila serrata]|uniref:uncharacterized protein LOC110177821 n=1 Tax=Drosophila serrata TaxID=7274 RepID=UPI000A1D330B|nr:uncharacterized protein LOC110177821 [Drosophila serrata]